MYNGFVYLWYDTQTKKFYVGSHLGTTSDGYVGELLAVNLFHGTYSSRTPYDRLSYIVDCCDQREATLRSAVYATNFGSSSLGLSPKLSGTLFHNV